MSCNRELYKVQLRVWITKGKNPDTGIILFTEAVDFDDVFISGLEKDQKEQDIGCFKSVLSLVEKNKGFLAGIKFDPDPFIYRLSILLTARKNGEILPAAFLYIKRRDLADDVGLPSRIGVYMEKITFPYAIGNVIAIKAESADRVGF